MGRLVLAEWCAKRKLTGLVRPSGGKFTDFILVVLLGPLLSIFNQCLNVIYSFFIKSFHKNKYNNLLFFSNA